jgi:hypothetical protein
MLDPSVDFKYPLVKETSGESGAVIFNVNGFESVGHCPQ